MPINRDLSDLPRGATQSAEGWKPDVHPRYGIVLANAWAQAEAQRPSTRLARFRHSDAGACARALAYAALDVPVSDPIDAAGVFITTQGSIIHEAWQRALEARYGEGVTCEMSVKEGERGGHLDAIVHDPSGLLVAIETKSVGGFRFKKAVGCPPAGRTPEGPDYSHVIQAALGAHQVNADEAVILYLTREAISVEMASRYGFDEMGRIAAEWTIDRATFTGIAEREIRRVERVLDCVDGGELPKRVIPDPELPPGHLIVRPAQGAWVQYDDDENVLDAGTTWHCNYCRWQTLCASHPATRVSLTEVGLG